LTAAGSERNPSVQLQKRLPLKMVISEMASRDRDTVETETELEHKAISPHTDDTSLHTFLSEKRDPSRYFRSSMVLEILVWVLYRLNTSISRHQLVLVLLWLGMNSTLM
jgi:hypothetical protein